MVRRDEANPSGFLMVNVGVERRVYIGWEIEARVEALVEGMEQTGQVTLRLRCPAMCPIDAPEVRRGDNGDKLVDLMERESVRMGEVLIVVNRVCRDFARLAIKAPRYMAVSRDDITRERHEEWQRSREAV